MPQTGSVTLSNSSCSAIYVVDKCGKCLVTAVCCTHEKVHAAWVSSALFRWGGIASGYGTVLLTAVRCMHGTDCMLAVQLGFVYMHGSFSVWKRVMHRR